MHEPIQDDAPGPLGDRAALLGVWVLVEPRWNGAPGELHFRPDDSFEARPNPKSRLSKAWDPGRFQVPFSHRLLLLVGWRERLSYEFFVRGPILTLIDDDGEVLRFKQIA
jgi:hypothetical protein